MELLQVGLGILIIVEAARGKQADVYPVSLGWELGMFAGAMLAVLGLTGWVWG